MIRMETLKQLFLSLLPLTLTPLFGFLLAEGLLDLGGGEKDIIWAFVWAVWSVLFAISSLILIWRGWPLKKWIGRSMLVAMAGLLAIWGMALVLLMLRQG